MKDITWFANEALHLVHGVHFLESVQINVELNVVDERVKGSQAVEQRQGDINAVFQSLQQY